jgi:hypothetical protein
MIEIKQLRLSPVHPRVAQPHRLTNPQWWAIAIAVTMGVAAWLQYVIVPLRIWRPRAQQSAR